jgi:hypothetical protein
MVRLIGFGPPPEATGASFGGATGVDLDRLGTLWLNLFNTATPAASPGSGAPFAIRPT